MKHLNFRMYAMVFALVCIWIIFTVLTNGTFLTNRNLFNLSRQATVIAILAMGMVYVIISANIDLSVGFGAGLLGAITAILHVRENLPIVLTLLVVVCIGILIGLMHGFLIAYQRIPAFIVTLGGFLVYQGLMLAFTKGETIALPDNWLKSIGTGHLPQSMLLELDAIAACVIGGASLMGGRGTIFGAILGAFVMASLTNGMSLANMGPAWQDIVKGVVLVAAVGFDMVSKK